MRFKINFFFSFPTCWHLCLNMGDWKLYYTCTHPSFKYFVPSVTAVFQHLVNISVRRRLHFVREFVFCYYLERKTDPYYDCRKFPKGLYSGVVYKHRLGMMSATSIHDAINAFSLLYILNFRAKKRSFWVMRDCSIICQWQKKVS